MMNNEYRSLRKSEESRPEKSGFCYAQQSQFSAPTGRQATVWGNALGLNAPATLVAPSLIIEKGDEVAWGKREENFVEWRVKSKE